jgi:uncharacterized protein
MPQHTIRYAMVFIAALTIGRAAVAQAPTTDAAAAARELVVTMRAADQLKTMLPLMMQQLKPAIVQNRPQVEKDYDAIMQPLVQGMLSRSDELINAIADLYARNFTAAELQQVIAFYKGPVGQKFLERMPVITQESMAVGQRWGQQIAGEMRGRIIEELRKRGHNI